MKTILAAIVILFFVSCSSNQSPVGKKLSDCDSLAITFNAPNTDSVISVHTVADKKAIRKLAGFLSGKADEFHKCGYDGNMIFYKEGQQVMPVVFKYSEEGCRHFLYTLDEKLTSIRMSKEAANFLKSLAEGKDWY